MKRKGFTLVEIMIVVAIIALLAAIAIPNLLRARLNANDAASKATLQALATAFESYGAANGVYPSSIANLTGATPPYLNEDLTNGTYQGYNITCSQNNSSGYNCTATAVTCNVTGSKNYTVTTGNVWTEGSC
ncbi:type IV pilin protein [Candidatus Omnitrophota bacterium]